MTGRLRGGPFLLQEVFPAVEQRVLRLAQDDKSMASLTFLWRRTIGLKIYRHGRISNIDVKSGKAQSDVACLQLFAALLHPEKASGREKSISGGRGLFPSVKDCHETFIFVRGWRVAEHHESDPGMLVAASSW